MMQLFQKLTLGLSRLAAYLAAIIMIAMVGHVMLEIVLRGFFSTSTFVLDEFVGYGVAAVTFLALGYALEEGSLIRVSVLLGRIGRGWVRRIIELFCILSTLTMTVFIAWYFWKSIVRNWQRGAVSETIAQVPLWLPESLVFIGLVVFALQLLAYGLRILTGGKPIGEDVSSEIHGE